MLYLISEIVVSLAIASLMGVGIGYWLRASRASAKDGGLAVQLQRASKDVAKLEARLREVGPQAMVLEPRIAELESAKSELEAELEKSRRDADAGLAELERQKLEVGRLRESLEESRGREGDVEALKAQVVEMAQRAEAAEEEVAGLRAQISELLTRAEAAEGRLSDTTGELAGLRESLSRANSEAENRAERLLSSQARITELQRELFAKDASIAVLRERSEKSRADALDAENLEAQLAAEREAHEAAASDLEQLRSVHADCDFAFSTLRDQIVALRRRVAEVESGAAPKPRLAVAKRNGTTGTTEPSVGKVSSLPSRARPGWLLESPSRLPDDLKRINGVGLRLEKLLNDLGVFYFQQVADMSGADAAWLDDQLGEFRGKLYRDDWVEQARALVEGRQHLKEY